MTMLVMTKEGIYGARDRYGRTPLVIGKKDDSYCLSFESHAYINLGYTDYKELGPCEVVYVTSEGVEEIRPARTGKMKICSFLWVYYGYPCRIQVLLMQSDMQMNQEFRMQDHLSNTHRHGRDHLCRPTKVSVT